MSMDKQLNTKPETAKRDTSGEVSTSPEAGKANGAFSDLAPHDAIGMIVATALEAQKAGVLISIANGTISGVSGMRIWIPDYNVVNGAVVKL